MTAVCSGGLQRSRFIIADFVRVPAAAREGIGRIPIQNPELDCARYNLAPRSRSALPTTLTDDSAIAAAAMIGDSRMPKLG